MVFVEAESKLKICLKKPPHMNTNKHPNVIANQVPTPVASKTPKKLC